MKPKLNVLFLLLCTYNTHAVSDDQRAFYITFENPELSGAGIYIHREPVKVIKVGLEESRQGIYTNYYPDGVIESEVTFIEDVPTGEFISWYPNGQLKTQGILKDGVLDGLFTAWYPNGQTYYEVTFYNGQMNGKFTSWYENGIKSIDGFYDTKGTPDGLITSWDPQGQITAQIKYYHGIQVN